ncbi:zinc finger BED domain-containing protein 4-like isoform X1 [Entelurus aequoreus]|uniref:zinc finger BED domain-containing protein 4-like isoform X1 n=1 Tax=Entelurus aequoreus TaxID=161455 RepID=UPI002B1E8B74|nr:zinc finger BED domain-containing protein 4-like isoform X1 [Entelurus aequoreus]
MLRHLRAKHPEVTVMELGKTKGQESPTGQGGRKPEYPEGTHAVTEENMQTPHRKIPSPGLNPGPSYLEVNLKEADSNIITVNDTDFDSSLNGIPEAALTESTEDRIVKEVVVQKPLPSKTKSRRRSMIWRHFERLESLDACQCLICNTKIKYSPEGSTGNLHKHMSKRHPHVNVKTGEVLNQPTSNTSSELKSPHRQKTCPANVTNDVAVLDVLQVSQATAGERRVFRRELELIEAIRRTQREEAKAVEHQRELVEKLRAISTREAALEKKHIESLRRAQQDEAQNLSKQREELEREKAALQRK